MRQTAAIDPQVGSKNDSTPLRVTDVIRGIGKRSVCMIAYTNYAIDARVRREAETLAASGFEVLCLTTANGAERATFRLDGVTVRELGVPKYRGKNALAYIGSYLLFLLVSSAACMRLLAKGELDVVHVHNVPDFLVMAALLPRLVGSRVVLDVHDSVPEFFATKFSGAPVFRKILCLEERLSALVAHKVICVNHPQRDTLVARGIPSSKTFISMNVPDPRIFTNAEIDQLPSVAREHFNLVYHGTMARRLGVDLLIQSVALLHDRLPELRLHLWGSGDDLYGFQQLARDLGVADKVLFKPQGLPLHELPRHLRAMDVGIVGNRRSVAGDLMLPVKLMEYVALGIPAIVPRLRTIEHYFSDDMVEYFEPENVESLAKSIQRLHSEPATRLRQAERAGRFLADYGWDRQGTELVTFYQKLMEN